MQFLVTPLRRTQSEPADGLLRLPTELFPFIFKVLETDDDAWKFRGGALALSCTRMASIAASMFSRVRKTPDLVYVQRWHPRNMRWCPACKVLRPRSTVYWDENYRELRKWLGGPNETYEPPSPFRSRGRVDRRIKTWCFDEDAYADETVKQFLCPACLAQVQWETERIITQARSIPYFLDLTLRRGLSLAQSRSNPALIIVRRNSLRNYPQEWPDHICDERPIWLTPECDCNSPWHT